MNLIWQIIQLLKMEYIALFSIFTFQDMALSLTLDIEKLRHKSDGIETVTSEEQKNVEESVGQIFSACLSRSSLTETFPVHRERHINYLQKGLQNLSEGLQCLDASRPWLGYWIIHSLNLLGEKISKEQQLSISRFFISVQSMNGGFCGNVGHLPHLATTYASVTAIASLDYEQCYNVIDRMGLKNFIEDMHNDDGSFTMHKDGELDVRGAYCAAVVANLCDIYSDELFAGTAEWIAKCQTFEGGFGSQPGNEAHGGYTFCSLAALILLNKTHIIDKDRLLDWVVHRQMQFEGGFQGRTNKLVDGCYSFWQGGIFPLLDHIYSIDKSSKARKGWLFSQVALQDYILFCCQYPSGGLVDKPGKSRDYYHTCYCLSGLSIAQHSFTDKIVRGDKNNTLEPTHPIFNIVLSKADKMARYFHNESKISEIL